MASKEHSEDEVDSRETGPRRPAGPLSIASYRVLNRD